MIAAAGKTRLDFLSTQVAQTEPVLFERQCEAGVYEGYTENYTPVRAACGADISGRILPVKITEALEDFCTGEITCSVE